MTDRPNNAEEILDYLDRHGVVDKDRLQSRDRRHTGSRRPRKRTAGREVLDLHGMVSDEARRRVRAAVNRCRRQGIAELLIVHGRGNNSGREGPVLKNLVRRMLAVELRGRVRDFVGAPPRDGGAGATIVRLR